MNKLLERSFSNLQQMSVTIFKYIFSQEPRRLSHPSLIIISKVEAEKERKIQNRIHEREKTSSIRMCQSIDAYHKLARSISLQN